MNNGKSIKLFLVDDDAIYLKLLEIEFLEHADFNIEKFATGELCVANLSHNPDIIILDYYLNGIEKDAMNGIETLDKIKAFNHDIPARKYYTIPEKSYMIHAFIHWKKRLPIGQSLILFS